MRQAEQKLAESIGVPFQIDQVTIGPHVVNYLKAGHGKPLLLLHGANVGWGQWHSNIGELASHFEVYAIDLPGSGGTTRHDYRTLDVDRDYVSVVKEFIQMKGLEEVAVIAHSFGAVIGLKLGLDPDVGVGKLVLVGPLGFSDYIKPQHRIVGSYFLSRLIARTAMSPSRRNMKKFLTDTLHRKDTVDDEYLDYYYNSVMADQRSHPLLFMNSLTSRFKLKPEALVSDLQLYKITSPVLFVIGEHDSMVPLKTLETAVKSLPHARLDVMPDTGHAPNQERPARFNKLVIRFLNGGQA